MKTAGLHYPMIQFLILNLLNKYDTMSALIFQKVFVIVHTGTESIL